VWTACGQFCGFGLAFLHNFGEPFLWVVNKNRILSAFVGKVERGWREKSQNTYAFQIVNII
jgi:hypothetical protein